MAEEQTPHPHGEDASHEAQHPSINYWYIFYALCVLTGLSVLADLVRENSTFASIIGEDRVKVVICFIVLAVACAKALFVMLYFMHLKFEGKWKFVLLTPTIVLAMAIPAALMPDIGSHYYDYQVPQLEPDEEEVQATFGMGTAVERGPASKAPASDGAAAQKH
jgi:cytochrome c oxidase subunit 4